MRNPIRVVLAGIGGYGKLYVRTLLDALKSGARAGEFRIVAVADPLAERCERYSEIVARDIPVYPSLEAFYRENTADLAVMATPVQLHANHIALALAHGSHVLCEKPLASSMQDVRRLVAARDRAGRHVAIGYQWSYCPAIRELKSDVAAGLLGRPLRMRTLVLWPRGEQYYLRNAWAGRVLDGAGLKVLDSPLNNACAHFVHNPFFILGDARDPHTAAYPSEVTGELYRAHSIENYDTAVVRCRIRTAAPFGSVPTNGNGANGKHGNGANGTAHDVEAIFVASHAVPARKGPVFNYEFELGSVTYDDSDAKAGVVAQFHDGSVKRYGLPCTSDDPTKLWHIMDCIRTGATPWCGIEESAAQTALVCAAQESMPQIGPFPADAVRVEHHHTMGTLRWPVGLDSTLTDCYRDMRLPHEYGLPWALRGRTVQPEASPASNSRRLAPDPSEGKPVVTVFTPQRAAKARTAK